MSPTSTQDETIIYEFDISDEEDDYFDISPAFAPPANPTTKSETKLEGTGSSGKKTSEIEHIVQTRRTAGSKRMEKHQTLVDARNGVETMHSITAIAGYRHESFEVRRVSLSSSALLVQRFGMPGVDPHAMVQNDYRYQLLSLPGTPSRMLPPV